jgi:predicted PurR-regulated permease PerM
MEKNIAHYIKFTKQNIENLRKTLKEFKKEREAQTQPHIQHQDHDTPETREELLVHFSIPNVAKVTITILALIALSHFIEEIAPILIIFFIAILFSSALSPTVNSLQKKGVPRSVSVLGMFLILFIILGFFISQLIPLVATQLLELARSLNGVVEKVTSDTSTLPFVDTPFIQNILQEIDRETLLTQIKDRLESLSSQLENVAGDTIGAIKSVFDGIVNFVVVLVLTFFLTVNQKDVNSFFISLFPSRHGRYITDKISTIQNKIGYWLRGQMILMLLMFSLSLIGMMIIGLDNALTLAMMTGIAELIPVVGPVAAGIPAILVGFNESPWMALWVIGLIFILQQIEGHILVPTVMRKAVGLNPIIIILAMLVGLKTLGIVGMIMAVPVATTLSIFVSEYAEKKK